MWALPNQGLRIFIRNCAFPSFSSDNTSRFVLETNLSTDHTPCMKHVWKFWFFNFSFTMHIATKYRWNYSIIHCIIPINVKYRIQHLVSNIHSNIFNHVLWIINSKKIWLICKELYSDPKNINHLSNWLYSIQRYACTLHLNSMNTFIEFKWDSIECTLSSTVSDWLSMCAPSWIYILLLNSNGRELLTFV